MEQPSHTHKQSKKFNLNLTTKTIAQAGVVVVLIGVSFYGGVAYQKSKKTTDSNTTNTQMGMNGQSFGGGQFGPGGGRRMMSLSDVTAVSSTSISVKTEDGTAKTYIINSATSIIKDGASATTSDITTGDKVVVTASTDDASVASRILVNPGMVRYGGPQGDTQTN